MSNVAAQAQSANSLAPPSSATAPIGSPAEAEQLMVHLLEVMEALLGIVERETELVRAGKLPDAAKLEPTKTELSHLYVANTARIKANQDYLSRARPTLTPPRALPRRAIAMPSAATGGTIKCRRMWWSTRRAAK